MLLHATIVGSGAAAVGLLDNTAAIAGTIVALLHLLTAIGCSGPYRGVTGPRDGMSDPRIDSPDPGAPPAVQAHLAVVIRPSGLAKFKQ